ncbi:MAG: bifunctional hydroxymethylpyrimidine kinase/phosphomethylpyrimidine kinase [Thermoprotei archaeon]|nr:MAG: bifunctional hydroxymethylpyrimidine kinase/phosphomethylpyrimidine kinase [Thermoprotei archaeon]RLF19349.1 MAG: bifunctional hydroxymethylpyrimidine kinase/phosphomethylpyrimidine kinase [Thermoprotei archaeon]
MRERIPTALTIAGSDSGGCAGIVADIKTFAALGVHGMVAITAITAQNTYSIEAILDVPADIVVKQIEVVVEDMGVDAAKTGMLSNAEIVHAVAKVIEQYNIPLVVDPVIESKSGVKLLKPNGIKTLKKELLPIATLVTPNKMEAELLTGIKIRDLNDARKAAKYIVEELGAKAALVKGGHIAGDYAIDVLYCNGNFREYRALRLKEGYTHGAGCSFSAAITAELAKGKALDDAIKVAKEFITKAIAYGYEIGMGFNPVNPIAWLEIPAQKYLVIHNLERAIKLIEDNGKVFARFIPEVQTNIVMALPKPYARGICDVAGVLGRIVRVGDTVKAAGPIAFGASSHVARAVLKIMEYDKNIRAAMNLRYDERLLEAAKREGLIVSYYDRREEPPEIKKKEGATIPWGIEQAVKRAGTTPDIIYHLGDWGKEPMITIFGKDAVEVVKKALKLISAIEA